VIINSTQVALQKDYFAKGEANLQLLTEEQEGNRVSNSRATKLDDALAAWDVAFKDFQKLQQMPPEGNSLYIWKKNH
jgi:hypothetical protein